MLFSHWCPSSQSCETTRFQTSGYVTILSENFSSVGYKKDPYRKGGCWFFLRAITLSFPSNELPFSCLTAGLALFFSAFTLHSGAKTQEGRPLQLGGLLSQAHLWRPLPRTLPRNLRCAPGTRLSACLAELTSTHWPTFYPSVRRVSEIPFSWILSLSLDSFPSPSARREHPQGPWALGLGSPSDSEIRDAHFKADYYSSLRKSQEQGSLFSQTFLLAFSQPRLTSLLSCNGEFSIPALKIYSSRMPSLKPWFFKDR